MARILVIGDLAARILTALDRADKIKVTVDLIVTMALVSAAAASKRDFASQNAMAAASR